MSRWTEPRTRALLLSLLAAACAHSCGTDGGIATLGAGGASATGKSSAATSSIVTASSVSASSSGAGGCSNDKPDPSWGVPDGWHRAPGTPCDCSIYLSPDPAHMKAPSPWQPCGDGCLELVRDWSKDDSYTFVGAHGVAGGGLRYIGYLRYLKPGGPNEIQLVRFPGNQVIFDAYQASDAAFSWNIDVLAMSESRQLLQVWKSKLDNSGLDAWIYLLQSGNAIPELSFVGFLKSMYLEAATSSDMWALSAQPPHSWQWHSSVPGNQLQPGYSSPGYVRGLAASGSSLFFDAHTSVDDIMVFDPVGGNRKLITFASAQVGGACGLRTDGKDMAWYQGGPINGNAYTSVNLMAAPFATSTPDLKPQVLRPAFQNVLSACGGTIGGGYHLGKELQSGGAYYPMVLTRLSDGYYWVIPPRPSRAWAEVLYVDDEELAIVEVLVGKPINGAWTIVRRTIAPLGPPRPPGSGFDP